MAGLVARQGRPVGDVYNAWCVECPRMKVAAGGALLLEGWVPSVGELGWRCPEHRSLSAADAEWLEIKDPLFGSWPEGEAWTNGNSRLMGESYLSPRQSTASPDAVP